jgi:hypothetical protein
MKYKLVLCAVLLAAAVKPEALFAQSCASLAQSASPGVSITLSEVVPEGTFTIPDSKKKFSGLPGFCRVAAKLEAYP